MSYRNFLILLVPFLSLHSSHVSTVLYTQQWLEGEPGAYMHDFGNELSSA